MHQRLKSIGAQIKKSPFSKNIPKTLFDLINKISPQLDASSVVTSSGKIDTNLGIESVDIITGTASGISNGSEGMISSRFQEHSWVTDDGAIHILANTNEQLTLYTAKAGTNEPNFEIAAILDNSNKSSRSDGLILGNTLYLTYSTDNGGLAFSTLSYNDETTSWTAESSHFSDPFPSTKFQRPSIAVSEDGTIYVAFTSTKNTTDKTRLRAAYSKDGGSSWILDDRSINNTSNNGRMSGDIMTTDNGVGLLYTNGASLNWVEVSTKTTDRNNPLTEQVLLTQGKRQKDPKGTHFSSLTDTDGNIHVATNNGKQRVIYLRYDNDSADWEEPVEITDYKSGSYMQISILENDSLLLSHDARRDGEKYLEVAGSTDGGKNWSKQARLEQQISANPGNPRVEAPSYAQESLPIFQQVESNLGNNSLVYFEV